MAPYEHKSKTQAPRSLKGRSRFLWRSLPAIVFLFSTLACTTVPERRKDLGATVRLPFMRVESGECYFVDDFLPTPDLLVTGKSAGLFLRYYTYESAIYKLWDKKKLMLAFYSRDNRCWSLFEEYPGSI